MTLTKTCLIWAILLLPLLVIAILLIIVPMIAYSTMHTTWDDAYFFARYAKNYLDGAGITWNAGESPTYGLTSQLYFAWVTAVYALTQRDSVLSLQISSHFWGGVTMIATIAATAYATNKLHARIYATLFAALTVLVSPQFYFHFSTGMDTTLATAFVALLLLVYLYTERSMNPGWAVLAGAIGSVGYLVRPDLMLFAVVLPFGLLWHHDRRTAIPKVGLALAATIVTTGLILATLWRYYGTPVPLPFYAKTMAVSVYDPAFRQIYRYVASKELASFFVNNALLLACISLGLPGFSQLTGVLRMALLAAIGFCVYYLVFVLQIMHDQARFYYPIYPILVVVAANQLGLFIAERQEANTDRSRLAGAKQIFAEPALRVLFVFLAVQIYVGIVDYTQLWRRIRPFEAIQRTPAAQSVLWETYRTNHWSSYWYRLDLVTTLPDFCTIAATEVGMPGVLNPGKNVIDLAGLNDPVFARNGIDPELLFKQHQPDVIYLPHPDYKAWVEAIEQYPGFQTDYRYFPSAETGALLGFAIRSSGPCYDAFVAAME